MKDLEINEPELSKGALTVIASVLRELEGDLARKEEEETGWQKQRLE